MDKSHRQIVRAARFVQTPDGNLELHMLVSGDCPIEIEEVECGGKLIRKVYDMRCAVRVYREQSEFDRIGTSEGTGGISHV